MIRDRENTPARREGVVISRGCLDSYGALRWRGGGGEGRLKRPKSGLCERSPKRCR